MKTLSETLVRGHNNFDLIRLLAALAVMLGHSYALQQSRGMGAMLIITHRESFGSLAVYAFFMISGMLVSASFSRNTSVLRFIGLRALRIWPGAIICAVLIALVVGPMFSSLHAMDYLSAPRVYAWVAHNASLMGHVGEPLPTVFEANHFKHYVNATVWTLPVELECYGIVLVAGLLGMIRSRARTALAVALAGTAFAAVVVFSPSNGAWGNFFVLPIAYSFYPVPFFFLGMLLHAYRDKVQIRGVPALLLVIGYLLTRYSLLSTWLLYPTFVYGLLWVASTPWLAWLKPKHDYSYGVYLYGFVVQQVVSGLYPTMNNYLALLAALPFTFLLAALSWHFIERPCLRLLRRRGPSAASVTAKPASASYPLEVD